MCVDPVTMLAVGALTTTAASSAVGIAGTVTAAQANAASLRASAEISDRRAEDALERGQIDAGRARTERELVASEQDAEAFAFGFGASPGALNTRLAGLLEQDDILHQARTESMALAYQADLQRFQADSVMSNAITSAVGQGLTAVASLGFNVAAGVKTGLLDFSKPGSLFKDVKLGPFRGPFNPSVAGRP